MIGGVLSFVSVFILGVVMYFVISNARIKVSEMDTDRVHLKNIVENNLTKMKDDINFNESVLLDKNKDLQDKNKKLESNYEKLNKEFNNFKQTIQPKVNEFRLGKKNGPYSYLPNSNGHTYLRPGNTNKDINIGDFKGKSKTNVARLQSNNNVLHSGINTLTAWTKNIFDSRQNEFKNTRQRGSQTSYLPHSNGNTYLRPAQKAKNTYLDNASTINLTSDNNIILSSSNVKLHLDNPDDFKICDKRGDNCKNVTLKA